MVSKASQHEKDTLLVHYVRGRSLQGCEKGNEGVIECFVQNLLPEQCPATVRTSHVRAVRNRVIEQNSQRSAIVLHFAHVT